MNRVSLALLALAITSSGAASAITVRIEGNYTTEVRSFPPGGRARAFR